MFKTIPIPSFSATSSVELDVIEALQKEGMALIVAGLGPFAENFAGRVISAAQARGITVTKQAPSSWLIGRIVKKGTDMVVLRTPGCTLTVRQAENWLVKAFEVNERLQSLAALEKRRAAQQSN